MHHVIDAWTVANVVRTRTAVGAMGDSREARGGPGTSLPAVRGRAGLARARKRPCRRRATSALSFCIGPASRTDARQHALDAPGNGERAGRIPTGPFATRG